MFINDGLPTSHLFSFIRLPHAYTDVYIISEEKIAKGKLFFNKYFIDINLYHSYLACAS